MFYNDSKLFIAGLELPFYSGLNITSAALSTDLMFSIPEEDRAAIAAMPLSRIKFENIPVKVAISLPEISEPDFPEDYVVIFDGVTASSGCGILYDPETGLLTFRISAIPVVQAALSGIQYAELSVGRMFSSLRTAVQAVEDRDELARTGSVKTVATAGIPPMSLNSILFLEKLVTGRSLRDSMRAPSDLYDYAMNNLLLPLKHRAPDRLDESAVLSRGGRPPIPSVSGWKAVKDMLSKKYEVKDPEVGNVNSEFHMYGTHALFYEMMLPGVVLTTSECRSAASAGETPANLAQRQADLMYNYYKRRGLWSVSRHFNRAYNGGLRPPSGSAESYNIKDLTEVLKPAARTFIRYYTEKRVPAISNPSSTLIYNSDRTQYYFPGTKGWYLWTGIPQLYDLSNQAVKMFMSILAGFNIFNISTYSPENLFNFISEAVAGNAQFRLKDLFENLDDGSFEMPGRVLNSVISALSSLEDAVEILIDRFAVDTAGIYLEPEAYSFEEAVSTADFSAGVLISYPRISDLNKLTPGPDILRGFVSDGNSKTVPDLKKWIQLYIDAAYAVSDSIMTLIESLRETVDNYFGIDLFLSGFVKSGIPDLDWFHDYVDGKASEYNEIITASYSRNGEKEFGLTDIRAAKAIYDSGAFNRMAAFSAFRSAGEDGNVFPTFRVKDYAAFNQLISGRLGEMPGTTNLYEILTVLYGAFRFAMMPMLNKVKFSQQDKSRALENIRGPVCPEQSVSDLFLVPSEASMWCIPKCNVFITGVQRTKSESYEALRNASRILVRYNHNIGVATGDSDLAAVTYYMDVNRISRGMVKLQGDRSTVNYAYTDEGRKEYFNKYIYGLEGSRTVVIDSEVSGLYKLLTQKNVSKKPSDTLAVNTKFDTPEGTIADAASLTALWKLENDQGILIDLVDSKVSAVSFKSDFRIYESPSMADFSKSVRDNPGGSPAGYFIDGGSSVTGPVMKTGDDGNNEIRGDLRSAVFEITDSLRNGLIAESPGAVSTASVQVDGVLFDEFMYNRAGIDPDSYNFYSSFKLYMSSVLPFINSLGASSQELMDSGQRLSERITPDLDRALNAMLRNRAATYTFFEVLKDNSFFSDMSFMDTLLQWKEELKGSDIWGTPDNDLIRMAIMLSVLEPPYEFRVYLGKKSDMDSMDLEPEGGQSTAPVDSGGRFVTCQRSLYYRALYPVLSMKISSMMRRILDDCSSSYQADERALLTDVLKYLSDNPEDILKALSVRASESGNPREISVLFSWDIPGVPESFTEFFDKLSPGIEPETSINSDCPVLSDLRPEPALYRHLNEASAKGLSMFEPSYNVHGMGMAYYVYSGKYYCAAGSILEKRTSGRYSERINAVRFIKDVLGAELIQGSYDTGEFDFKITSSSGPTPHEGYLYKPYFYISGDAAGAVDPDMVFPSLNINDMAYNAYRNGRYVKGSGTVFISYVAGEAAASVSDFNARYLRSSYIPVAVWTESGDKVTICMFNWVAGGRPVPVRNLISGNTDFPEDTDEGYATGNLKKWLRTSNPYKRADLIPGDIGVPYAIMDIIPVTAEPGFSGISDNLIKMSTDAFWNTFNSVHASPVGESDLDVRRPVADAAANYCSRLMMDSRKNSGKSPEVHPSDAVPGADVVASAMKRIFQNPEKVSLVSGQGSYAALRKDKVHNGQDLAGIFNSYTEEDASRLAIIAPCRGRVQYYLQQKNEKNSLGGAGFYALFLPETDPDTKVTYILQFAHMRIKGTLSNLKELGDKQATGTMFKDNPLFTDIDSIAEDHEYSKQKKLPRVKGSKEHDVPSDKMSLDALRLNLEKAGNSVKLKAGDFIGYIGHTGSCSSKNVNKWGEHLHLSAFQVSTDKKHDNIKYLTSPGQMDQPGYGAPPVGPTVSEALTLLAARTSNPVIVLSRAGFPNASVSESVEEEQAASVSSSKGSNLSVQSLYTDYNMPPEDLVEMVARNAAYREILNSMSSVQLDTVTLPYYDPYFVDGGFPFAVIYKDDIVLTKLAGHAVSIAPDGTVRSSLSFVPGISVRGITALILQSLSAASGRYDRLERLRGLGLFPPNIVEFFNKSLLNIDWMNKEYSRMFGIDDFVFDWRKAVVINTGLGPVTLYNILENRAVNWDQKIFNTYPPGYEQITIDISRITGNIGEDGESERLMNFRRWHADRLYTYAASETKPFSPKPADSSVTAFGPESGERYEQAAMLTAGMPGTTDPAASARTFYDWKGLLGYLKKYIR